MTTDKSIKLFRSRILMLCMVLLFGVCVVIARLLYLQYIQADDLRRRNDNQSIAMIKVTSPRGTISDVNGNPLAVSLVTYSLYADPRTLAANRHKPEEMADLIEPYVQLPREQIIAMLSEDSNFLWVKRNMSYEQYRALSKELKERNIAGFAFQQENQRFYPNGELLAPVLGIVNQEGGASGIEYVYDKQLKGYEEVLRIRHRQTGNGQIVPILESINTDRTPKSQDTLVLTIDATVQYYAEQALDRVMANSKPQGASVVVLDPKTGGILAMATRPTYHPETRKGYNDQSVVVRPVQNNYEAGSVLKPIIAASALMAGTWDVSRVYHDTGYINVSGIQMKNWDGGGLGNVTLLDILKYSINTGMIAIGQSLGAERLYKYLQAFGFGTPTHIEQLGEGEGYLRPVADVGPVDLAAMSIGQGFSVTALQLARAYSAFANDGVMMQPHLVKELLNPDGKVIEKEKITEVDTPVTASVANTINTMLEHEVGDENGGGHRAYVAGYRFAGKTGTAEMFENGRHVSGAYIASFVGYGPFPNPRFVIVVTITKPQGMYYGGMIAAPVFREIAEQLVRYYHIAPTVAQPSKPIPPRHANDPVKHSADGGVILPNFVGWSIAEVQQWLDKAELLFRPSGSGYGRVQTPAAGVSVEKGSAVHIEFGE